MQKLTHIITHAHLSCWGIIVEVLYVILVALAMYCITMLINLLSC